MNKLEENKKVYNAIDYGLNQKNKEFSQTFIRKMACYLLLS